MADVTSDDAAARRHDEVQELLAALVAPTTAEAAVQLLENLRGAADCGFAALVMRDGADGFDVQTAIGNDPDAARAAVALPEFAALLSDGDVTDVVRVIGPRAPDDADRDVPRVLLGAPIAAADRVHGLVLLGEPGTGEEFGLTAELAARTIASAAAVLADRRTLIDEHEQRHRWLTESTGLTRDLLSGEHDDPLGLFVDRVRAAADADLVVVVRQDGRGNFIVANAAGEQADSLQNRVLPSGSLSSSVIAGGEPVHLRQLADSGRSYEIIDIFGSNAAVLIPFITTATGQGMLGVLRNKNRPAFTDSDIAILNVVAGQIALAVELADSRDSRERSALLDERDRIARDLHDHVIQRLFAIGLTMQSASMQADNEDTAQKLMRNVDDIDETIGQIRATIYRLTGPILTSDMSIRARAAQIASDLSPVLGFAPQLEARGPVDFAVDDDMVEDCVAFLRETLSNIARHAHATSAQVVISVENAELSLEVRDNGDGIGDTTRRSGLANLRARAERHGGTMHIDSAPGQGTTLRWVVPMDD